MTDVWLNIPQSVVGNITPNERLDLIDLYQYGLLACIEAPMGDTIRLTTLQPTYMQLRTSKVSTTQVKMIGKGRKLIYVVVKSIEAPTPNSHIEIYNAQWEQLPTEKYLTLPTVATFFNKSTPPTPKLLSYVTLPFIQYTLCDDNNDIIATASFISTLDINIQPTFEAQCSSNLLLKWKGRKWEKPQPLSPADKPQQ